MRLQCVKKEIIIELFLILRFFFSKNFISQYSPIFLLINNTNNLTIKFKITQVYRFFVYKVQKEYVKVCVLRSTKISNFV